MPRSILWFRRDLRLVDHPALAAAHAHGDVVALYVADPVLLDGSGLVRREYLRDALRALNEQLGGALVVRHGRPADVVAALAAEVGADTVYVSRDYGPYGRRRDAAVAARLRADGRALAGVGSPYAVDPGTVTKADGTPYAVFTPFSRAWLAVGASSWRAPAETPQPGAVTWIGPSELNATVDDGLIPEPADGVRLDPAVRAALPAVRAPEVLARWEEFRDGPLAHYDEQRDLPAVDGTSRLSAALRWGLVHPRTLLADLAPSRAHEVFRSELAWRDFYADVLFRRPETAWSNLQPAMDAMPVDTDARAVARLEAWCQGRTGYPVVDAGMRQLLATGWMHNRVRMIVASFLVKDLHLPWQWGARHFMAHLVDGDLASNNHGWQWAAGTGTDAAPYFRVFNPTAQGERFDPDGAYVRRWVPELRDVAGAAVHRLGLLRPDGYPEPIVDHAAERDEALRRYRALRADTR